MLQTVGSSGDLLNQVKMTYLQCPSNTISFILDPFLMYTFISPFFNRFMSVNLSRSIYDDTSKRALYRKLHDFPTYFRRTESVDLRVGSASPALLGEDGCRI